MRMNLKNKERLKSVPAEAWFDPTTGRLVVGVWVSDAGIEDAHRDVKSAKVSVVDWKGSTPCKLDFWPYAEADGVIRESEQKFNVINS